MAADPSSQGIVERADYIVGRPVVRSHGEPSLRSGADFVASLRDGRKVIIDGRDIDDVTQEPTLKRGIESIAGYFDAQFDPATRDDITIVDRETGERSSTAWLVPRTKDDLRRYDRMIRHSTYRTFGVFGRPADYGPVKAISFVAWNHLISKREPDAIHKVNRFLDIGRRNNLTSADLIVDVQANRKLGPAEVRGRVRVVEERRDGIVVSGAKAGSSVLAQGNIGTISMPPPGGGKLPEECMIWAAVPANASGVTHVMREAVATGAEAAEDHPLNARGEESDSILLFDRVFIPWEYVFSYKNPVTSDIYNVLGRFSFFKIATRLSYRAEIFAGTAQMIVDALGTDHIQPVRALVAEVCQYAALLRGMMAAAIEESESTESGVMLPNHACVTAGRLLSIEQYPRIVQNLRELSGQGLISRVPAKTWDRADIGGLLDAYLPGNGYTAREKNRFFNYVWDLTCSAHAMRVALFENINATPAAALKEELYRSYDRSASVKEIRQFIGLN